MPHNFYRVHQEGHVMFVNFELSCAIKYDSIFVNDYNIRSSHPWCSVRESVFRNFVKFTGKHLCQGLFFATLLKKRFWHRCFPVNFRKFLRTPFYTEHFWWLLLTIHEKDTANEALLEPSQTLMMELFCENS